MVKYVNKFLEELESKLPPICADRDLIDHLPDIFRNPANLSRMRGKGNTPPYFRIPPHIYYLREDVIAWLRERYKYNETFSPQDFVGIVGVRK